MANEAFVITKILHVFLAVAWIGALLYVNILLMPLVNRLEPAERGRLMARLAPWNAQYGNWAGGFTLLTGVALVSLNPYGIAWSALHTTYWGRLVIFSLVAAAAMLYLINVAMKPTFRKIQELMQQADPGEPPPAGVLLLQKRATFTSRLVLIIGLSVVAAMVTANSSGLLAA